MRGLLSKIRLNHKRTITKVPVIDHLDPDDIYDFILVIVRKNQVADLLPVLAQNKSPNIVFMGNNLSGPDEFAKVVDKKRIMLGMVVVGGKRDGDIIRAMVSTLMQSPFGEMDGTLTPRLMQLVKILRSAGIKATTSTNMIDLQMTHTVGVALIGKLTMKYNCDLAALARSTEDLKLFVEGGRGTQSYACFGTQGYPVRRECQRIHTELPTNCRMARTAEFQIRRSWFGLSRVPSAK